MQQSLLSLASSVIGEVAMDRPDPIPRNTTVGAVYIGSVTSAVLLGLSTLQTFLYFKHYSKDHRILKCLIAMLWIINLLHAVSVTMFVYVLAVPYYSNVFADPHMHVSWEPKVFELVTNVSNTTVRCIYGWRVWNFSDRNWFLSGIVAIVILTACGFEFACFARLFSVKTLDDFSALGIVFYLVVAGDILSDLTITAVMCCLLWRHRSISRRTQSLVDTLITYTIQTSFVPSLFSVGLIISFAIAPMSFIFMGIYFNCSQLHLISLLCTLNIRRHIRLKAFEMEPLDISRDIRFATKIPTVRTIGSDTAATSDRLHGMTEIVQTCGDNRIDL